MFVSQSLLSINIYSQTDTWNINENCVLYITRFWSDNDTPSDPTDDIYLGSDVILDCKGNDLKNNDFLLNPYFSFLNDNIKSKFGFDKPVFYSNYLSFKNKQKKDVESLEKIKIDNDNYQIKYVKVIKN